MVFVIGLLLFGLHDRLYVLFVLHDRLAVPKELDVYITRLLRTHSYP
jgi:hypothetical protein